MPNLIHYYCCKECKAVYIFSADTGFIQLTPEKGCLKDYPTYACYLSTLIKLDNLTEKEKHLLKLLYIK